MYFNCSLLLLTSVSFLALFFSFSKSRCTHLEHFWPPNLQHIWNPIRRTESCKLLTPLTTPTTLPRSKSLRAQIFTCFEPATRVADSCSKCVAHLESKTVPNVHSKWRATFVRNSEQTPNVLHIWNIFGLQMCSTFGTLFGVQNPPKRSRSLPRH